MGNTEITYNMVAYKSRVIHVEYDTLNFCPTIYNRNAYPEEYNNCLYDYSAVLIYEGHLGENIIPEHTYPSSNKIPESRDSVLFSLHIGGAK